MKNEKKVNEKSEMKNEKKVNVHTTPTVFTFIMFF